MSKKKKKKIPGQPQRRSFPEEEKSRTWLGLLMDAYHIIDKGVAKAIASEKKKGKKLACAKGCSNCCRTHNDIPIYPLEIIGITWYVTEKIKGDLRETLKTQLERFKKGSSCPFLVEGSCSVHAVRPMACRQFNVFTRPCEDGEDPFYTRREDVLDPVKKHVDQAFYIMLPYYGVEKEAERLRMVETGEFHKMAKELQSCSWRELYNKMERYDNEADDR